MNSTSDLATSGHHIMLDHHPLPKKLNIKASKGLPKEKHLDLNSSSLYLESSSLGCQGHQHNKTERGGSDEQNEEPHLPQAHDLPSKKLLVIKKSKIRKFMEMKKREKQKELLLTEQNEMLKAIRMQENMTKLNEFCKKNLMKNVHKKRNATIQH